MRLLVTGASGFVGGRLVRALADHGHDVAAMTRRPDAYAGPGTAVHGDIHDPESLRSALRARDVAYYLVHSLDRADFQAADAAGARTFGAAAAEAGVERIVYLGGLGDDADDLSAHLRSRREARPCSARRAFPSPRCGPASSSATAASPGR
ncbi:MAG: hypothetical protein QOE59_2593 [Actinomycetota bacterium]|nr:hypothetical protein [Actinomycetota bacterium]